MRQASSYGVTAVLASVLALSSSAWAVDENAAASIGNAGGLSGPVQLAAAGFDAERRPVGRQIGSGDPIYQGDQIVTGPGGRLQLMLLDQTIITLGENARMTIDDIAFNPANNADGKISVGVERGAFRFISGQVAQAKPENVNIRIPTGNIGIRGTIVGGSVGSNQTLVALLGPGGDNNSGARNGAIVVSTPNGSVDITRTGYGTVLSPGQPPSPPTPLTPAQIQLLNTPPSPPSSSTAPSTPERGSAVSAAAVSGAATAVGVQLATVVSTASSPPVAVETTGLISNAAAAKVNQPALGTQTGTQTGWTVGTSLTLEFRTNYQVLEDSCFCTTSPPLHTYSILYEGDGTKSLTYTQGGFTLAEFNSSAAITMTGDGNPAGLLYSIYGYVTEAWSDGSTTRYFAFGTGIPTPLAQMPSSGAATYSGGTTGYIAVASSAASFSGAASLTANFSSGTIGGTLSNLTTSLPGVQMGNITLSNGSISGARFSGGTATGSITQSTITPTSGSFAGGFNGPGAAEVAGSYAMSGSVDSTHLIAVVGSFGAKK